MSEETSLFIELRDTFQKAIDALVRNQRILEDRVQFLTQEVEKKNQLLDSILNSIDVGVVFFDELGKIKVINNSACKLLNVQASEILDTDYLPADILTDKIKPHNSKSFDALISRVDVVHPEGHVIGNVLIFKDITRIKALEAENERNRRLSAMGELILKIAHEIRNPLGSIELFASLLKQDLKGTTQGSYAERISHSVMSLVNTLDNMLRYSKGIKPNFTSCDINILINELHHEFAQTFNSAKVNFIAELQENCIIQADKDLIRQALINIMINAIQAMPGGGTLQVNTKEIAQGLEITISDTGKGMDEETLSHIFEPFYSTKDRGTGLGMSITQSIIQAHNGNITVQSQTGKGSRFTIILPKN